MQALFMSAWRAQDLNRHGGSTTSESETDVSRSALLMSACATRALAMSNPLVPTIKKRGKQPLFLWRGLSSSV